MKIYAIYAEMVEEPICYVEAKDINHLKEILNERNRKGEPFGMFPGWCPVEVSKEEMDRVLNHFNENDIELIDEDKREAFNSFANMQLDDASIIEELKKYRLFKQKYSVNLIKKRVMEEFNTPTNNLINNYLDKFKKDKRYYLADQAIINLFQAFPKNEKIEDIMLKISVINDLYSTNILATFKMAEHIQKLEIDKHLKIKDLSIVNKIAIGHDIHKEGKSDINFYSFATKYCNWNDQDVYPIYDKFVHKILKAYQKKDNFCEFADVDLKNYERFVEVIKNFKQYYSLTQHNMKEIDKFLWIYGKEKFPNKQKHKK